MGIKIMMALYRVVEQFVTMTPKEAGERQLSLRRAIDSEVADRSLMGYQQSQAVWREQLKGFRRKLVSTQSVAMRPASKQSRCTVVDKDERQGCARKGLVVYSERAAEDQSTAELVLAHLFCLFKLGFQESHRGLENRKDSKTT